MSRSTVWRPGDHVSIGPSGVPDQSRERVRISRLSPVAVTSIAYNRTDAMTTAHDGGGPRVELTLKGS